MEGLSAAQHAYDNELPNVVDEIEEEFNEQIHTTNFINDLAAADDPEAFCEEWVNGDYAGYAKVMQELARLHLKNITSREFWLWAKQGAISMFTEQQQQRKYG